MADKIILVDTPVLIDCCHKTGKENAALVEIVKPGYGKCFSKTRNTAPSQGPDRKHVHAQMVAYAAEMQQFTLHLTHAPCASNCRKQF